MIFLAVSPRGSVARKLLVKSRSVGERIEIFVVTWPNSQEQGLVLNELDTKTNRKADIVGSLTNLSTRRTLGTAMLRESGGLATAVFYISFLLDFHGSFFVLDVSCAPNIEPSSTGRSTVNAFSASYSTFTSAWFS